MALYFRTSQQQITTTNNTSTPTSSFPDRSGRICPRCNFKILRKLLPNHQLEFRNDPNKCTFSQETNKIGIMVDQAKRPRPRSQWPWSRRRMIWDPPTALDRILDSPLRLLIQIIYFTLLWLRGASFKPPKSRLPVRVVCLSDTHTNTLSLPHGDVLIHAGDLTNAGTVEEIQKQLDWLASQPHKEKIVIAGNHDSYLDPNSRKAEDNGKYLDFKGIHYLQDKALTLKFKGGRKLNFYGAGDIPKCGGSDHALVLIDQTTIGVNRMQLPIQSR